MDQPLDSYSSRLGEFERLWADAYRDAYGRDYVPRPRDTTPLRQFLAACRRPLAELVQVAREAWKRPADYHCKNATSIGGFCDFYNAILTVVDKPDRSNQGLQLTQQLVAAQDAGDVVEVNRIESELWRLR
jgi:hypothetical protein